MAQTARELGAPTSIIEAVAEANRRRKNRMAQKVIAACGGSVVDKTVSILGLAFKQNTDDMREAPAIDIISALHEAGARVRAYDPQAIEQARPMFPNPVSPERRENAAGKESFDVPVHGAPASGTGTPRANRHPPC